MHRIALGESICNSVDDLGTAIVENTPANGTTEHTAIPETLQASEPTERLRDSLIALAKNLDEDIQPASEDVKQTPSMNTALLAMADTLNTIDRSKDESVLPSGKGGKHYLVIGQYRALRDAEKVKSRHSALGTKVRMILKGGALLYQVTAGPFDRPAADGLEAKLNKKGLSTHVALLCADGVTPAPCHDSHTQLTVAPASGPQFKK